MLQAFAATRCNKNAHPDTKYAQKIPLDIQSLQRENAKSPTSER